MKFLENFEEFGRQPLSWYWMATLVHRMGRPQIFAFFVSEADRFARAMRLILHYFSPVFTRLKYFRYVR